MDLDRTLRAAAVVTNMATNTLVRWTEELLPMYLGPEVDLPALSALLGAYGRAVVAPPLESWEELPIVFDPDEEPLTFHTSVRLWFDDGTPSPLVLKCRLVQEPYDPVALDAKIVALDVEPL